MPLWYVSASVFKITLLSLLSSNIPNVHRLDTILFYPFWTHWDFWICKLYPSQNLGNYWLLFLQIVFCTIPSSLLGLQMPQSLEFLILSLIYLYIYLIKKNLCFFSTYQMISLDLSSSSTFFRLSLFSFWAHLVNFLFQLLYILELNISLVLFIISIFLVSFPIVAFILTIFFLTLVSMVY